MITSGLRIGRVKRLKFSLLCQLYLHLFSLLASIALRFGLACPGASFASRAPLAGSMADVNATCGIIEP